MSCLDAQNKRGGRVKLQALTAPESEYNSLEKGDALYAMELTLSLEVCPVLLSVSVELLRCERGLVIMSRGHTLRMTCDVECVLTTEVLSAGKTFSPKLSIFMLVRPAPPGCGDVLSARHWVVLTALGLELCRG